MFVSKSVPVAKSALLGDGSDIISVLKYQLRTGFEVLELYAVNTEHLIKFKISGLE